MRLIVSNGTTDADLTNLVITETLPAGMTYVPGSVTVVSVDRGNAPTVNNVTLAGSTLTIRLNGTLDAARRSNSPNRLTIDYQVYRSDEALIASTANRRFSASLSYSTINETANFNACSDTVTSGNQVLPLREPRPSVIKVGWNVDAGHLEANAFSTVYGNNNDDVIWRVDISNAGTAPLEDLIFSDNMLPGNFSVNYACTRAADAVAVANADGAGPGACFATYRDKNGNLKPVGNTITDFAVDDPFGTPGNDETGSFIDISVGGIASVYLVGKMTAAASCDSTVRTNTVSGIEWGCEFDSPPDGGITATSTGATANIANAFLSSWVNTNNFIVNRQLTGTNTAQPVGTKGTMTITITNLTGGTVKNIKLTDALPPEYVVDPTYVPTAVMAPAYGRPYDGMIDNITWDNPAPGTYPTLTTTDPLVPLTNNAPVFSLTSTGCSLGPCGTADVHPNYADQLNMMRHGDVLTVTFRVVLVRPLSFDKAADLDVHVENIGDGTDPTHILALNNTLTVEYDTFCAGQGHQIINYIGNGTAINGGTVPANPEDLDIDIPGANIFILTNDPTQQLTLPVTVTNNGGHDAVGYHVFVSFGATMDVVTAPAGCALISPLPGVPPQPAPWKTWVLPASIPSTATVYECTSPVTIAPGQIVPLNFNVIKTIDPVRIAIDDLSFRADVVGEILLSNPVNPPAPLWFPAPIPRADGQLDRANNYSLDGIRARVIGFNLIKTQLGTCNENNPPLLNPDSQVQIGEECIFHLKTGGWFGFQTPGFTYIAVENITLTDQLPAGQGYISSTDPYLTGTTAQIQGISLVPQTAPPLNPVDAGWIDWNFNKNVPNERITQLNEWFNVNVTTRILNDPINVRGAPNQHTAISSNVLNSTFDAVFVDTNNVEQVFPLGPGSVGYPLPPIRTVSLTVTEPHLSVVKEVCNESLYGAGPTCGNWVTIAADGDTYDSYIYRITVRNAAAVGGLPSAPAYDVVVTDTLDASDLMYVLPFNADGLDNDGDATFDEATIEGAISDNVVLNSTPAVLTFSHTHSTALQRIDPGKSVQLYYRVDPDQRAAPLQQLTNTVTAAYDSLEGSVTSPSGNQTVDLRPNGDIGGAREYITAPASATVQIIPLLTYPKEITRLSNGPVTGAVPEPVEIGEEVEYKLTADLPVARLNGLSIQDYLPAGMSCSDAPVIDLTQPPYDAAGFTRPDGTPITTITQTCSGNSMVWYFGDVVLTKKPAGSSYFRMPLTFIARVDNAPANIDGVVLSNGRPATNATLFYWDELNNPVLKDFGQIDVMVTEPQIALTKSFDPVVNADAGDELTVTVTATNTGTANAYNLRILDDLVGRNLTFIGGVSGTDPPAVDTTTFGPNQPIFVWASNNPLVPGATRTFTFKVRVDLAAQPLELLDNTLQADWTSLPSQATALNSTGKIGLDGTATGMRIGALPNAGDPLNDYETTAQASVSVLPLTMTKTDDTPAVVPTIGAHKQFTVTVQLPEGTTKGLRVEDNLNAGGVSYVLTRDANFDVAMTFTGIASINGQPPAEAVFNAPIPVDGASGTIVWDIGEVVTNIEDDLLVNNISPSISITYHARIDNNDLVQATGTLQNGVTVSYLDGETAAAAPLLTAATPQISVVEPVLGIGKTVTNTTGNPTNPAGGDVLEYVVTITNTGGSAAHEVNIADTLPAGVVLDATFTPTATINTVPVTGFNPTPTVIGTATVWGRDNGDNSLVIGVGETLVLTYRVVIEQANGDLINTAYVDWTSLAGPSGYERTGAGCPTTTLPNDYCAGPAQATITATDTTTLTKAYLSDSWSVDGSTANDAVLRVGDTVTYSLTLSLQEGRTSNVRIEDVLDPGLAFLDVVSINGDTAAPYSADPAGVFSHADIPVANVPAAGQTGTLLWTLGDIYNALQDSTNNDFTIVYRARVVENVLAKNPSTLLNNTATMRYIDGGGVEVVDPARLVSGVQLEVRQPVMTALTKIDTAGGRNGTGTQADPFQVDIANDVMNFRLETRNATGLAPAYNLLLSDVLPPELDETSLTLVSVSIGGVVLAAADYVYTAPASRGGTMTLMLNKPVLPGQSVTVDYNIRFHTDLAANQLWANSAKANEFWSLPQPDANSYGQKYVPVDPVSRVWMTNAVTLAPPTKTIDSPLTGEATIGEEVVYRITVPGAPVNAILNDVIMTDTLNPALELVSVTDALGNPLTNTGTATDISVPLGNIPAGQQVEILLTARVVNTANTNAGAPFDNFALYSYLDGAVRMTGGSSDPATATLTIVEPQVTVAKAVTPNTPPTAGDILSYTVDLTATAGANFTSAYDLVLVDTLGLGLEYVAGTAVVGGVASEPTLAGDGINSPQTLTWPEQDITEGATVTVTYDVRVLDTVTVNQSLTNSVTARWTSLTGPSTFERNGSETPAYNDYVASATTTLITPDTTTLAKSRLADTWNTADANVRVGDFVDYELRIGLQEGSHTGLVLTDTLPTGLVFENVVSADFFGTPGTATPAVSGQTLTWNLGDVVNPGDGNPVNDFLVIVYRARVLNNDTLAQTPSSQALSNAAALDYTIGGTPATQLTASDSVNVLQPLLTVTKTAAPAGGDTVIEAGEVITYTVDIVNSGAAPAYDTVLVDTLPPGLRQGGVTVSAIALLAGGPLASMSPVIDPATGVATWNFDSGVADAYTIPAGDTLRVVYQVTADADLGAGLNLTNEAIASLYYSFDNDAVPAGGTADQREIYGPTAAALVTLTTPTPGVLLKETTQATAAIGEPFRYRITVPAIPVNTALHDVRITDDLTASAADLRFVSATVVSGGSWTLSNTGTDTNLVIEDTANGIDIPPGGQAVIEITVELLDTTTNVSGLVFANTAGYTYNQFANDSTTQVAGLPGTSGDMTIVGPDTVTLEKTGPATMRVGTPGTFTLNVQNTGTAPAWDLTITDLLPNPTPGGMCDVAPTNVTAQIFQADGVTAVSAPLAAGVDFATAFTADTTTPAGDPACTFTLTMLSPAAAIGPTERLIVTYEASLDEDNVGGSISLTNLAAATGWFSGDTAGAGATGAIRTYTGTLSDGTVGTLDEQDAHTLTTETSVLLFQKSVVNVTTGQTPGTDANPGDTLRYTLRVENLSDVPLALFSVVDELDALNASPLFVAGSLGNISAPAGADVSNSDPSGGANGTGLLDVRNLSLDAVGGANASVEISFEVTLAPVIDSGTVVLNQGQLSAYGVLIGQSDDPNINGADDPAVSGDEDPTQTLISSVPAFVVEKISDDLTGDPAELMAGDTLRYTITVKNEGTENAVNTMLRDQVPANTTYVANSTTLNGIPVADPASGISPLQNGILIHAPEDTTAGAMRADATATTANVATITFDVVINADALNGTIISNQARVNADGAGTSGAAPEKLSDDPATAIVDDPTRDVVGNLPLLDAHKTVQIQVDGGSAGIVDPGDTLRYTISVSNFGAIPANGVVFTDAVPANTTYVANSVTLNGIPVGQPDGGISPLIAGIAVNSPDGAATGVISAGQSAVVSFDVTVNAGASTGTLISNQGTVSSNELPAEPTDADGIDSNGDQPTVVVVGNVQLLSITKEVFVVGGGAAEAGKEVEYVITVQNIGSLPATDVRITDTLPSGQLVYVADSATLNGAATGVSFVDPLLTADYAAVYGDMAPGTSAVLRFRATIDPALAIGTTITNTGVVEWNGASQSDLASVAFAVGGTPGVALVSGQAWHDVNDNKVLDGTEQPLPGWNVQVYRNNTLLGTVTTDANGYYQVGSLAPNDGTAEQYTVRFSAPDSGSSTAALGLTDSIYTNGLQTISQITVTSGSVNQNLNLPLLPNGVIYEAISRTPVAGAVVTMLDAASQQPLPASCFDDAAQQNQVTLAGGHYRFDLNFSDAACAPGGEYLISVSHPSSDYEQRISQYIPPQSDLNTPAFSVPGCLGSTNDAVPATADLCEVVALETAPPTSIAAGSAGTHYHLHLLLNDTQVPGSSQLFNNHIPLDPVLDAAVAITKTAGRVSVSRSEMVPYTITVNNGYLTTLQGLRIVDTFPAGFKYVKGSARYDGQPLEPTVVGNQLHWENIELATDAQHKLQLLFIVGAGVSEGEYINRAHVVHVTTGDNVSGEASATVRVVPDPTFDCTDVTGKVFDDKNLNGYQDEGEAGLPGARLVTARGLIVTADEHGRFHITCAVVPNEDRGSNFILKLDDRSLPSGYRVTSENPRVQRATRGKMMKFNFGATIHRVVRMDVADGVFERDSAEMRPQWLPRINLLLSEMQKAPAVLRLSYLADVEDEGLVKDRVNAVKARIADAWEELNCCYKLTIETEVYWRRGAPPARSGVID